MFQATLEQLSVFQANADIHQLPCINKKIITRNSEIPYEHREIMQIYILSLKYQY